METEQEALRTSGVVEAVAQHDERRYSIKLGGEWYGGFGTCPVEKGKVYVIDYALRGRFRNIRKVREVGEAVAEIVPQARHAEQVTAETFAGLPVAVKNYVTATGWHQTGITAEDEALIQNEVRKRNSLIAGESLEDARRLLGQSGVTNAVTPRNLLELALHLSERRTLHISEVYEEFLKAKIAAERRSAASALGESAEAGA